ncbi:MAG: WecB/TagA/CpsF family glycosyltransferase [Candidatus Kerfeldbacteria bacterium]|nr:WecB/TagA/CpsF family glycosyltransferase [Candidatus Kerfeldbacteria bacterium]
MFRIFGLPIASLSLAQTLECLRGFIASGQKHLVVTANPEILTYAHHHPSYAKVLKKASLLLPDGAGVVLASCLSGQPIFSGRVTGVELVRRLIKESPDYSYTLFLAGSANKSILDKTTQYFSLLYGKINIVGVDSGPTFSKNAKFPLNSVANDQLLANIEKTKPDILLVAFGHPKQELWLDYYLPKLPVHVGIGVGGSFDYFAGVESRAPGFLRAMGLEWLWRLLLSPKLRFKRIFTAVVEFPLLLIGDVLRQMFHVEHFK